MEITGTAACTDVPVVNAILNVVSIIGLAYVSRCAFLERGRQRNDDNSKAR